MLKKLLTILFFSVLPMLIPAQQNNLQQKKVRKLDSLNAVLSQQTKADTIRARTMVNIAELHLQTSQVSDETVTFIDEAYRIAVKEKHRTLQLLALLSRCRVHDAPGEYHLAIYYADSLIKVARKYENKMIEGRGWWVGAIAYSSLENYSATAKYTFESLKIAEEIKDKWSIPGLYGLLSDCFYNQNKLEEALIYRRKELEKNIELNRRDYISTNINAIAEMFVELGQLDSALIYNQRSEKLVRELGNDAPVWQLGYVYGVKAGIYEKKGDLENKKKNKMAADSNYHTALKHYLFHLGEIKKMDSLKNFVLAGSMLGQTSGLVGRTYYKLGEYNIAEKYIRDAIRIGHEYNAITNLSKAYSILSSLDSVNGSFKEAFIHYKFSRQYHDSIFNTENSRLIEQYKNENDFEKKEKDLQLQIAGEKLKSALAQKRKQQLFFTWVMTCLVLSVAGLLFYRYRRLSKIKAEQKLLKERLTISQDLHDHVGSTLSSISVYSKVAQIHGEENKKEEMNELLGRIRSTSNAMVTEMNDIVWAINPVNDTMEKMIRRMEAYARPLLEARNIAFYFDFDESLFENKIDMEKRKNFYLIFKEAINNAAKYSAAPAVHSSLYRQNGNLLLEIKDNGIGFNPEQAAGTQSLSGNGLRNMQTRAGMIGGQLLIESKSDLGTKVLLTCPV